MANNVIKLDYDGFKEEDFLYKILQGKRFVLKHFSIRVLDLRVFSTVKGFHVYIDIAEPLSGEELVFVQLALGSDFARECFNWDRVKKGYMGAEWNVLFKKKFSPYLMTEKPCLEISKQLLEAFTYEYLQSGKKETKN